LSVSKLLRTQETYQDRHTRRPAQDENGGPHSASIVKKHKGGSAKNREKPEGKVKPEPTPNEVRIKVGVVVRRANESRGEKKRPKGVQDQKKKKKTAPDQDTIQP